MSKCNLDINSKIVEILKESIAANKTQPNVIKEHYADPIDFAKRTRLEQEINRTSGLYNLDWSENILNFGLAMYEKGMLDCKNSN